MTIIGNRICTGTFAALVKRRIKLKPMIPIIRFANKRPMKMAYTSGAFSRNSSGPGWRPCTMRAPIIMAVAPSPGIPKVSTGMKVEAVEQ